MTSTQGYKLILWTKFINMAIADITESLRRSFISLKSYHGRYLSFGISSKVLPNFKVESFLFRGIGSASVVRCRSNFVRVRSTLSPSPSASSSDCSVPRTSPGQNIGASFVASRVLFLSSGSFSRGLASKAHMTYTKRRKAPVDRFGGLDPAQPRLGFEKVKALEDANAIVKKIFSLEFGTGADLHKMRTKITEDLVHDKPDEKKDLAVKIATITEHIRAVSPHVERNKKDSTNKVRLLNAIDRRRKMLKYLRKRNYERFERLLGELDLTWTPPPEYYRRKTRRSVEKKNLVREAHTERMQALTEFEARWREEKILEIAKLKEELGNDLGEEEKEVLDRSWEDSAV